MSASDDPRLRAATLFVELASRRTPFADVVRERFAEWRCLLAHLKDARRDDGSALSRVASACGVNCEFESWGRERSPLFADEWERFVSCEAVVEACAEDLGARDALARADANGTSEGGVGVEMAVERSFERMQMTPSVDARVVETEMETERVVAEKPRRGGLGAAARVETAAAPRASATPTRASATPTREPMRVNVTPPVRPAPGVVKNSPPPTPMPAQLSPPQSEYVGGTPKSQNVGTKTTTDGSADAAHVEHLMSYLTGFHGLLFGLKDHVKRIREATVENVAHELARTDARLDTAIARLEAAMGVESGRQ